MTNEELASADARLRTINHELVCSHNDLLVVIVRTEDMLQEAREENESLRLRLSVLEGGFS